MIIVLGGKHQRRIQCIVMESNRKLDKLCQPIFSFYLLFAQNTIAFKN
jgi:hypothetical protein